jgi:hypothetical protein
MWLTNVDEFAASSGPLLDSISLDLNAAQHAQYKTNQQLTDYQRATLMTVHWHSQSLSHCYCSEVLHPWKWKLFIRGHVLPNTD